MPQTIFCANGSAGDKVEIPVAAVQKSLPKRRESAEKVEIPVAAVRKSLPKKRKNGRKCRDSHYRHPEISTQKGKTQKF